MGYGVYSFLITLGLFSAMLALLLLGRHLGRRRQAAGEVEVGIGPINAAIFGLLGLMIAFVFSGAATRFDERRDQIVEEANDIGTAWLRIDLLPEQDRPRLRGLMRDYTDSRLATYRALPDEAAFMAGLAKSQALQARIWNEAVAMTIGKGTPTPTAMLLLPALNDMFDITTTRRMAVLKHPPPVVYLCLAGLALLSSLLAGHAMSSRQTQSLLHLIAYPAIISVVVNLVINIEHPRLGLVPIDAFDVAIEAVRQQMDAP